MKSSLWIRVFSRVPLFIWYPIARFLAWMSWRVIPYRRHVVVGNLKASFPEWTDAQRERVIRDYYRGFADMLVEVMRSLRLTPQEIADIAASFQEAVIDCLVGKAELALKRTGFNTLCVGGGVAANKPFRERLEASAKEHGYELHIPPFSLCTDNAVMGAIAVERLKAGKVEDLTLDVLPGLERMAK